MYRVMIVDDEPLIRTGLINLIDWAALDCVVVCETGDGAEAWEWLEANQADIVVCDIRMPCMDGLELAKKLFEHGREIKLVFLSAFSEFSYVQAALRYQAADYVVKSNYIETLPEVIRKTTARLERERSEAQRLIDMEQWIDKSVVELRERMLLDLLRSTISDETAVAVRAQSCGMTPERYCIIALEFDEKAAQDKGYSHEKLQRSIKSFIVQTYKWSECITVAVNRWLLVALVSLPETGERPAMSRLIQCSQDFLITVQNTMGLSFSIGISTAQDDLSAVNQAFKQAAEVTERLFFFGVCDVCQYNPDNESQAEKLAGFNPLLDEILSNIYSFCASKLDNALEMLLNACYKQELSVTQIKNIAVNIALACHRKTDAVHWYDCMLPYRIFYDCRSAAALCQLLTETVISTREKLAMGKKKYGYLVSQAATYIREHFSEDVSVTTIAQHLHVNKSYLGNLFKKETGESIVDAINRSRLDAAIALLRNPENQISEISWQVGFGDPTYFSTVFKRYMGMSPKAYRSRL